MMSLNSASLPPACKRSALWLSFLAAFQQASSSPPSPHISQKSHSRGLAGGVGWFLLLSPLQDPQSFSRVGNH